MNTCKRLFSLLLVQTLLLTAALPWASADSEIETETPVQSSDPVITDSPTDLEQSPVSEPAQPDGETEEASDLCQHQAKPDDCPVCYINELIASLPDSFELEDLDYVTAILDLISAAWQQLDGSAVLVIGIDRYAETCDRVQQLQQQAAEDYGIALTSDSYSYLYENQDMVIDDYTLVTEGCTDTYWSNAGWYVVVGNVVLPDGFYLWNIDIKLLITDGSSLTLKDLTTYSSVEIYGQRDGSGTLYVNSMMASDLKIYNCNVVAGETSGTAISFGSLSVNKATITATGQQAAISGSKEVLIENSVINATGGYNGIYTYGAATIIDSTVNATGTDNGIFASNALTVEGSNINATGGTGGGLFSWGEVSIAPSAKNTGHVVATGDTGIYSSRSVTISGGNITAVTTSDYGYGIGPSQTNITSGYVDVVGKMRALFTGDTGDATVFVDAIENMWNKDSWHGNIYVGSPVVVNSGETLYIPEHLAFNKDIINNGTVYIDGDFTGNISGNAPYYKLQLIECSAVTALSTYNGCTYAQKDQVIVLNNDKACTWLTDPAIAVENNQFVMPGYALTVTAYSANNNYIITIPSRVTLEPEAGQLVGSFAIKGDVVSLSGEQQLYIQVSSVNNYTLIMEDSSVKPLEYTLETDHAINNTPVFTDYSQLNFNICAPEPEYAGSYSDTLIFSFSLK